MPQTPRYLPISYTTLYNVVGTVLYTTYVLNEAGLGVNTSNNSYFTCYLRCYNGGVPKLPICWISIGY